MSLTILQVKNAKPKKKPYKLADQEGLYLLVNPNGSKLWKLKYRFTGKEKKLSLGGYPTVSLADARNKKIDANNETRKEKGLSKLLINHYQERNLKHFMARINNVTYDILQPIPFQAFLQIRIDHFHQQNQNAGNN